MALLAQLFNSLTGWFKSFLTYVGAFATGIFAEKYHDAKTDLSEERKRDKVDAAPHASFEQLLDDLDDGKL